MKTTYKISIVVLLFLATVVLSGCASNCGGSQGPIRNFFANQPIRSTFNSWFAGDNCDACNAPTGMLSSPNVAPACDTCAGGGLFPQSNGYSAGQVQPLYGGETIGSSPVNGGQLLPQAGPVNAGAGGNAGVGNGSIMAQPPAGF